MTPRQALRACLGGVLGEGVVAEVKPGRGQKRRLLPVCQRASEVLAVEVEAS